MKKRILSLALAVLCLMAAVVLPACGGVDADKKLPVVCGETGMTEQCGVATYGVNYYSLGVKAGDMAADILLNGADPATMPVATDPNPALTVNKAVAEEIGFTIPQAILDRVQGDGKIEEVTRVTSAIVESGADFTVGILQLVQHVALDQSNKGFQDQLSARMAAAGKTVTILDRNASGEESNNITIAENFVNQNVDLIYTIATSSSTAAASATKENKIPVLFCAVTDPVGEKLVESMEVPGGNVSGVSDINPVAKQIELCGELVGKDAIKVGFLYTAGEPNSVYQVGLGKTACLDLGYTCVERGMADINDLESAFLALKNAGVDIIYIPTDNTLANGAANVHIVNKGA